MRTRSTIVAGVTLIEIMVSLVLVSTVLLVSLTASANLMRNDAVRYAAVDSRKLAGELLDEITANEFRDPEGDGFGLEAGESSDDRWSFDDLDDYHGYTQRPPTHRDGSEMPEFDGWTVEVAVTPATPLVDGFATTSDPDSVLRRIEVICTSPGGESSSHWTLVSDVSANPPDGTSYQRWRELTLEFPDRKVRLTVPLRNRPAVP